jgi:hypothetical protein
LPDGGYNPSSSAHYTPYHAPQPKPKPSLWQRTRHIVAEVSGVNSVRRCITGHQVGDCVSAAMAIVSYVPVVGTAARVGMIAVKGAEAARAAESASAAWRVYGPTKRLLPPYRLQYPGPDGSPQHMDIGIDLANAFQRQQFGEKFNELMGGPSAIANALVHLPPSVQATVQVVGRAVGAFIDPF